MVERLTLEEEEVEKWKEDTRLAGGGRTEGVTLCKKDGEENDERRRDLKGSKCVCVCRLLRISREDEIVLWGEGCLVGRWLASHWIRIVRST